MAYAIPNLSVELSTTSSPLPVLWWRVVGSSHTAFAVEAFMDEVALPPARPFAFRRKLSSINPA